MSKNVNKTKPGGHLIVKFIGGGEEPDDHGDPVATAQRELREELNISAHHHDFRELLSVECCKRRRYLFELLRPVEWGEFEVCEGAGVGYFSKEDLERFNMYDGSVSEGSRGLLKALLKSWQVKAKV